MRSESMFYVYNLETSKIMKNKKGKSTWKSYGAAKAFRTRMACMGYNAGEYGIVDTRLYSLIEKQVEKTNLMTGKKYMESVNTPLCCSPSSETYWSM
jgi:hypothetical protein